MLSATPVAKATIRQQQASHRATLASRLQQSRMFHSLRSSSVYVPRSQAGGNEPFNEGAAQVKRLISRDRQEFLGSRVVGNQGDIMEKWQTEFGEDAPSSSSPAPAAPPAQPAAAPAAPKSPFGSASAGAPIASPFGKSAASPPAASPFGSGAPPSSAPYKPSMGPRELTPDMGPDPILPEEKFTIGNIIRGINLTQIVIVTSFTLIILLMLGTFNVVLNAGGVRLAGLD